MLEYLRLHGSERMYRGSYEDPALDDWADRIDAWARGREPDDPERVTDREAGGGTRDIYVYFDNDEKTRAPFDARRLMECLGTAAGYPRPGTDERQPD